MNCAPTPVLSIVCRIWGNQSNLINLRSEITLLLFGLSFAAFLASTSGVVITPFLLTMADDLGTDLAGISLLVALNNLTWAGSALATGRLSDRFGRKPIILIGLSGLATCSFGAALAEDYLSMAFWRVAIGLSCGMQSPTTFAAASDMFPAAKRGRALGSLMTGQSMAIVLGAPLSALIGSISSWRWSVAALGFAAVVLLLALIALLPRHQPRAMAGEHREVGLGRLIVRPHVWTLFCASALERVCYASAVVFFATYLITTYEVPLQWLAGALIVIALGNVVGAQIGGRLADSVRAKHTLLAGAMVCNGALAIPLLMAAPGVVASIGLGLLYNLANAIGRPSLTWLISELSRQSRGAIMGFHIMITSTGWLAASALGGYLISVYGFGALGLLAAACGLGSALFAALAGHYGRSAASREVRTRDAATGVG